MVDTRVLLGEVESSGSSHSSGRSRFYSSSYGSGRGGEKTRDVVRFQRRSDAIAYGSPYRKAAVLVDLAEDGIGIPEEVLDQPNFGDATRFYFIFIQFDFLWFFNYFALLALNFFEKPLWCPQDSTISCDNRDYYFLGQLPFLTGAESLIYEVVTFVILMAHVFFPLSFEGFNLYWRSYLNSHMLSSELETQSPTP